MDQDELARFQAEGYLVVPDAVPAPLCRAVIETIIDSAGLDLEDPRTWYQSTFAGHGIVPVHHPQSLWDVRQFPGLHEQFSRVYNTEALWVSMDRVSYKPPISDVSAGWEREPLHWDCDPWQFSGLSVQGVLYLTDTEEDQGAFCCVPEIYQNLDVYLAEHRLDPDRRHPEGNGLTPVPGKAGSLVLFNRLMPHSSLINQSAEHRFVQYVTMQPAGTEKERQQRVRDWEGKVPPQWAIRQKLNHQQIPEPGAPATLSPLGRKLVGLDAWT